MLRRVISGEILPWVCRGTPRAVSALNVVRDSSKRAQDSYRWSRCWFHTARHVEKGRRALPRSSNTAWSQAARRAPQSSPAPITS
eukprot:9110777-Pyramimonas_sp.AAC.1